MALRESKVQYSIVLYSPHIYTYHIEHRPPRTLEYGVGRYLPIHPSLSKRLIPRARSLSLFPHGYHTNLSIYLPTYYSCYMTF